MLELFLSLALQPDTEELADLSADTEEVAARGAVARGRVVVRGGRRVLVRARAPRAVVQQPQVLQVQQPQVLLQQPQVRVVRARVCGQ